MSLSRTIDSNAKGSGQGEIKGGKGSKQIKRNDHRFLASKHQNEIEDPGDPEILDSFTSVVFFLLLSYLLLYSDRPRVHKVKKTLYLGQQYTHLWVCATSCQYDPGPLSWKDKRDEKMRENKGHWDNDFVCLLGWLRIFPLLDVMVLLLLAAMCGISRQGLVLYFLFLLALCIMGQSGVM